MENSRLEATHNFGAGQYFGSGLHQLAHELRTPLHQISGFAELLLMDKTLSPAQAEYGRAILSAGETLNASVLSYLAVVDKDVLGVLLLPPEGNARAGPLPNAEVGSCGPVTTAISLSAVSVHSGS